MKTYIIAIAAAADLHHFQREVLTQCKHGMICLSIRLPTG